MEGLLTTNINILSSTAPVVSAFTLKTTDRIFIKNFTRDVSVDKDDIIQFWKSSTSGIF